jgi:hypothetical protein
MSASALAFIASVGGVAATVREPAATALAAAATEIHGRRDESKGAVSLELALAMVFSLVATILLPNWWAQVGIQRHGIAPLTYFCL